MDERFKIEKIDGFYYSFVKLNEVWEEIKNYAIHNGKILSIGGACSTIERAEELIELAKKSPKVIANTAY